MPLALPILPGGESGLPAWADGPNLRTPTPVNQDEIAFFNQQLSGMLTAGIPLEGALSRLCGEMKRGLWRREIESLNDKVQAGMSLTAAAAESQLPPLYRRMLEAGVRSGDLPQVLNELADHYRDSGLLWGRVRGAASYPLITLFGAAGLSLVLCGLTWKLLAVVGAPWAGGGWVVPNFTQLFTALSKSGFFAVLLLAPVLLLVVLALMALLFLTVPSLRMKAAWRMPVFREARLARASSAVAIALRRNMPLTEALALGEAMEPMSPATREWSRWRRAIEAGQGKTEDFAAKQTTFPKVFGWLLVSSGEDLAAGFHQAKTVFADRARGQADRLLIALTPALLLFVGALLAIELVGAMRVLSDVLPSMLFN
jgi:general secretion pathway protein F